jgi:uncharacterized paraquat-inducible protein A
MQKCSSCGIEFRDPQCPRCGGEARATAEQIKRSLKKRALLLLAGLIAVIVANRSYPLLDGDKLFAIAWCAFFLPMILSLISAMRWGSILDANLLKAAYLCCAVITVVLALLIAANGSLDRSPVGLVKSSILRTSRPTRRYAGLNLFVASWRPGRSTEKLWAGVPVSITASPGDSISFEVHEGFFGLPWYGNIKILWN